MHLIHFRSDCKSASHFLGSGRRFCIVSGSYGMSGEILQEKCQSYEKL